MEASNYKSATRFSPRYQIQNISDHIPNAKPSQQPIEHNYAQRDQVNPTNSHGKQSQTACPDDEGEHRMLLGCPFYKFDRGKYQDCLRLQLKRVKDVKQHISRRHMQAPYCPSCGLEFGTQEEQIGHSRLQQCQIKDFPRPDGITYSQRDSLSTRARRNQGLTSQWFDVWDLLFPDKPRPASVYVEHPVREAMDSLRELWGREGLEIISLTCGHYHEQNLSYIYNKHLPIAVADAMSALFDQFLKKNHTTHSQAYVGTTSRGREAVVSSWDHTQSSESDQDQAPLASLTSHFFSARPGSIDFGTLFDSENASHLKYSGLDESMMGSEGFLAEGCNSWTDFSVPAEHQKS